HSQKMPATQARIHREPRYLSVRALQSRPRHLSGKDSELRRLGPCSPENGETMPDRSSPHPRLRFHSSSADTVGEYPELSKLQGQAARNGLSPDNPGDPPLILLPT